MGLTGAVANTAGFISPYIVGVVVEENVSNYCIRSRISTSAVKTSYLKVSLDIAYLLNIFSANT